MVLSYSFLVLFYSRSSVAEESCLLGIYVLFTGKYQCFEGSQSNFLILKKKKVQFFGTLVNIGWSTRHNIPADLNLCLDVLKSFNTCFSADSVLCLFLKQDCGGYTIANGSFEKFIIRSVSSKVSLKYRHVFFNTISHLSLTQHREHSAD